MRNLIHKYDNVVRWEALKLKGLAETTGALDFDDLISCGQFAIIEALEAYKDHGVTEKTYVKNRVRMRMIDTIRSLSPYSRSEAKNENFSWYKKIPIDTFPFSFDDGSDIIENIETQQRRAWFQSKRKHLTVRQQDALVLYLEGCTFRKMGDALGVSEARAHQIIQEIITKMKGLYCVQVQ